MNKLFDRIKKVKPYKMIATMVFITFTVVFSNSLIFHLMENHYDHSKVFMVNLLISIALTVFIIYILYIFLKYTEKNSKNTIHFDENVLNLVLDNLDTCIYMTEIETGEIIFINKKMRSEFGGDDFIGKICWKVLQDGFKEQCSFCPVHHLKKDSSKPYIWEEHNTVTKKYYENTDTLIKWTDGRMVHMQHSVDITRRKMSEIEISEALNKLELVMLNYPGIIMSFDEDRKLSFSSGSNIARFEEIKGYLSGDADSKTKKDFSQYSEKMDLAYQAACSHWTLDFEDESYNCFLSPIINDDNKVIGALFAANDMSEAVKMQKELQLAIDVAEQASKAKSNFLSRMSHEMRTPMNAIIGMAKIAQDTEKLEKIKYCLNTIDASSRHLLGLINDVLDMAKIEANKFVLEHELFNLEKMIMNVSNIILDKVEEKKQTLHILLSQDINPNVIGDELRLSQVLTNLLSNAVKFTPKEGKITLSVEEVDAREDYCVIRFSVTDNGIGMTTEQQAKLFSSFEQADETIARKYGGTGLGLAISKNIVEKMDGKIWVESKTGAGSKFSFEIRIKPSSVNDTKTLVGAIKPSDLKVLIVDDSEDVIKYFMTIMDKFNIPAQAARSGREAIDLVVQATESQKPYDVIFLDWRMPEMDGIETAKHINTQINKNTAIIMISVSEWIELEDLAKSIGINRFIPKPLFPSAILNAINEVIGQTMQKLDMKLANKKEKPDFSNVCLLLVDDVKINRDIFIAFLENTNVKIETAENGVEAVGMFRDNPDKYDLIIMDIQMPEMDGYEATRAIRAMDSDKAKNIPIIAMTANAFKEDVDKCIESGMNNHLAKPIDKEEIYRKLSLHIHGADIQMPTVKTAKKIDLTTFLPFINVKEMEDRLGDSMDIYPDLLNNFLQNEMMIKLKKELDEGNQAAAKDIIHTLKGIAGNLSLNELYKKALDIEIKIKENTCQQSDIIELEHIMSATENYIQKLLNIYQENENILKC